jgi:succinate dehydrogenase / fumarate reductase membrane anchor subunit
MCWFIINFVGIFDKDYADVLGFFSTKSSKILFSLFLILAFFFSNLSISEVFEDYINDEKNKNAANKALQIFAIVVPLITIIIVFNLNI